MTELYRHRDDCRLCHSTNVEKIVPLHPIPVKTPNLGDGGGLVSQDKLQKSLIPVDMYRCSDCGLLQLLDIINPEIQYTDFQYKTAISLGLEEHFTQMADDLIDLYRVDKGAFVFEIGSNDGTLLQAFKDKGMRILGIDPARNAVEDARAKGLETVCDFFSGVKGKELADSHGKAKLIISNNTFANLDDLDDILAGVKEMLAPDGVFVVETSYGASVIEKFLIDTVYHEHLTYFLVGPLEKWFAQNGFELIGSQLIWTKGGSLRLAAQLKGGVFEKQHNVFEMIEAERKAGLDQPEAYHLFSKTIAKANADLADLIKKVKSKGGRVAAFGASVGTVTLLHQLGIATQVDAIFDDKPLSDKICGPDYDIPIIHGARLVEEKPDLVIILAVRYAEPIMKNHADYLEQGGTFVIPLPDVKVVAG